MVALVDTTVLVDILRKYQPSVDWFEKQSVLTVTSIAAMELIAGALNKQDQERALSLIARFELFYLNNDDLKWAMQQQITYALSHNTGLLDCLIAAPSHRLQVPLYTRNLKHFAPILGDLVRQPY